MSILGVRRVARFSDEHPVPAIRFDSVSPCGELFEDVIIILEPESPNPAIMIPKPIGANLVADAMGVLATLLGR